MDQGEFEELGLYDPGAEHALLRLELLRYLTGLGASADELLAYRDSLPSLAMVLAVRGGPVMSLGEAAERSGLNVVEIRRLSRAAGFPDVGEHDRVFTEGFVGLAQGVDAVAAVFGEESLYQLLRVLGAAMARVADAVVSAFLVNVEPTARRVDPVGLAVAQANVEAAALLPMVVPVLDVLFRQHLLAAQRTSIGDEDLVGYETQTLAIGFADLVGSTELGELLSTRELGDMLASFELIATDTVTAGGGRVVKLIGDEVMFTAPGAAAGCAIALDLAAAFEQHPLIPAVRSGVAFGPVMLRDGDVFGPVVNLAARTVKVAQPGEVLATLEVSNAAGVDSQSRGRHRLKGVGDDVELWRIMRD